MKQRYSDPFTLDRVVRLVISILATCGILVLLYILRNVLLPFIIAWLFAYMLNPVVRFFKRKLRVANSVAVIMTLLSVLGILVLLGFIFIPIIETEIWHVNSLISNYDFTFTGGEGQKVPVQLVDLINRYIDFKAIKDSFSRDNLIDTIEYVSPALQQLLSNTISILLGFTVIFIIILYLIFIMLDYDKINDLWRFLIPPKYRPVVLRIAADVERNMNTYFRHQAFICLILGVLYAVGFQIIGLPLAIIFGFCVGLIHMIPYLQVITFPPAILLCWLGASQTGGSFWTMIGLVALVYIVVQCMMDLFLVPKIMGKAMGLNPAIILLSLSIWGYLLGIVGMIIAIPLTTLLLSYYKEFITSAEKLQIELKENDTPSD